MRSRKSTRPGLEPLEDRCLPSTAPLIAAQCFSLDENASVGSPVGQVQATDPDAGQSLTYSILAGNEDGIFALDPNTGILSVADNALLDHEWFSQVNLTIRVTDDGSPSLSASALVTIAISNLNEPPRLEEQTLMALEDAAPLAEIGFVFAEDEDLGQALTYSILSGNESGLFSLDSSSGLLSLSATGVLNFEVATSYALVVQVTDSGEPSLAATATVTVSIHDVNEAPFNTVPDEQDVSEDQTLIFSSAGGNAISIQDVDVEGSYFTVILTVSHGTLSVEPSEAISVVGDDRRQLELTGLLGDLNAVLNGLIYLPDAGYHGVDSLSILSDDQAFAAYGGSLSDVDSIDINVLPTPDVPTAENDAFALNKEGVLSGNLLTNDWDEDNDTLVIVSVNGQPLPPGDIILPRGLLKVSAHGTFYYVSDPSHLETFYQETFYYSITDGVSSDTATVTFTVGNGQWANALLGSPASEWYEEGTYGWSAAQALGEPNTPWYDDHSTAWSAAAADGGQTTLAVAFPVAEYAAALLVRESYGNGFVTRVDLIDTADVAHTVWTGVDPSQPGAIADFLVSFPLTDYLVKGAVIYVDTDHSADAWEQIDAVRLIGPAAVTNPSSLDVEAAEHGEMRSLRPLPLEDIKRLVSKAGHRMTPEEIVIGNLRFPFYADHIMVPTIHDLEALKIIIDLAHELDLVFGDPIHGGVMSPQAFKSHCEIVREAVRNTPDINAKIQASIRDVHNQER